MTEKEKPNVHSFSVKTLSGKTVTLNQYAGKVLLIVNTASACGFTPQLYELEQLRDEFGSQGFEVLGFPSNDFGRQEPLSGDDIGHFCEVNYGVKFPVFDKIVVKGSQMHPLFQFLSSKKLNGNVNSAPRWNFHKYLINQQGQVVDYFYPFTKPVSPKIKKKITQLLASAK